MGLRTKRDVLRKAKTDKVYLLRRDISEMIDMDGDVVTFEWIEKEGAVWNETYEVWEGGTDVLKSLSEKGIGKVVTHAEDVMEYEWGRVAVGDCIVRFKHDFDIENLKDKEGLRFVYKGRKWKPDSKLGIGDWISGGMTCKLLKGVKAVD